MVLKKARMHARPLLERSGDGPSFSARIFRNRSAVNWTASLGLGQDYTEILDYLVDMIAAIAAKKMTEVGFLDLEL